MTSPISFGQSKQTPMNLQQPSTLAKIKLKRKIMKYFAVKMITYQSECRLGYYDAPDSGYNHPLRYEYGYKIRRTIEVGTKYPKDIRLKMEKFKKEQGRNQITTDFICNTINLICISEKLKNILEKHATGKLEFIPFQVMDTKGKLLPAIYYVFNLVGAIDCVDKEQTIGRMTIYECPEYESFDRLVLDKTKISPDLNIFRLASMPNLLIINHDMRQIFEDEGITGMELTQLEEDSNQQTICQPWGTENITSMSFRCRSINGTDKK